jgi:hypothetical protein
MYRSHPNYKRHRTYRIYNSYHSYNSQRSQQIPIRLDSRLRGNDDLITALGAESGEILDGIRGML